MKEQIEEMRKDLIEIFDEEYGKRRIITADFTAIKMQAKGYRKQSDGRWEKVSDKSPRYRCTICNHLYNNREYKYCPFCGAKMKGGE